MKQSCSMFAVVAFLVAAGASAEPADPTWQERALTADRIAVGHCAERSSAWEGGRIVTTSRVVIERTIRGDLPSEITVRQLGGVVGDVGQIVSHVRMLEGNESYLLMLLQQEDGTWTPTELGVAPIASTVGGDRLVGDTPLETVVRELRGAP